MRWLWLALLLLLMAQPSWAEVESSSQEPTQLITFRFDSSDSLGLYPTRAYACQNFRVMFVSGDLGQVELHVTPGPSDPIDTVGTDTLINDFALKQDEPGLPFSSAGGFFAFNVTALPTAAEASLVIRCSNMAIAGDLPPAVARATIGQVGTTQTVNLDGSNSACDGGCTYSWSQTGGTACVPGIAAPTAEVTTAANCPYDEQLTFQLVVTSVSQPGENDSTSGNVTLNDPATFGCTLPATLPCTF